jgi:hypothetical protein
VELVNVTDLVGVLGLILLATGTWGLWGWAVAAIVVGAVLVALPIIGELRA